MSCWIFGRDRGIKGVTSFFIWVVTVVKKNIVSTVNLDCKLDLKSIALQARNVEYNPKVNASGQFCGVAEMIGRVDFNKNMHFWQQDKWNGVFSVKWHFVKDVPNPHVRHIILENNDNKPVTNNRDTQEAFNFVLRLVWVQTVMNFNMGTVEYRVLDFFMASLEIIRRGHWNFYRVENEHLNNVGKYRAVKTVPLPFSEMDTDD
ncbi:hypothetical protein IFM89_005761 [Coptis chinensis]|uniref:YTH domain-containing family protein n=1 Tax=Coptis chinensis TaxID=261450 RepID=A0A835M7F5_9MAGN|nr:hypothetical protein IFM89_005761 [Coptis chinensis]